MGEVWRAKHRMLARTAAVKLIRQEPIDGAASERAQVLLRRFEREAQATAALRSPHTVELYDFGVTDDGQFYYVMELLEGVDLLSLVRYFGPLPPERVVYLMGQVCESLADAHYHGLLHGDIKPANVHVCRMGLTADFVKVLDFGLVKELGHPGETTDPTSDSTTAGTPAFMAPELVHGRAPLDARTDLYSLGCVGYWLLTGTLVFESGNPWKTALDHVQTLPEPPSRRTELPVPASLEKLVLRCLAKNPEERPASAEDLAGLLSNCDLTARWDQQRARDWWELHQPAASQFTW
jgi:serine/threonine-protein kinase